MVPDFLVVGHVVQDLLDDGWRAGGAVTYAGSLARNLGLRTKVLTSCTEDFPIEEHLPGIEVCRVASDQTTQIRNVYTPEGRKQWVPRRAARITAKDLPGEWRDPPVVLLGPVAGEVDSDIANAFRGSLIGVGVQGWLRNIGPNDEVTPVSPDQWDSRALHEAADALFVSEEDLPVEDIQTTVGAWSRRVPIVALTRGDGGAEVSFRGEWRHIGAFPAKSIDPTGAGDIFAAAFLIRYHETSDAWDAVRFASAAASCVIEADGVLGVPGREQIEARLLSCPDIVARPF